MSIDNVIAKDVHITKQMVDRFREATQDTNKLHEEILLGKQMEAFLKSRSNQSYATGLLCAAQVTKFHETVAIDSTVWAKADVERDEPDYKHVKMTLYRGTPEIPSKPVATSELTYVKELLSPKSELGGHCYDLRRSDAIHVAHGSAQEQPDYLSLAIGLISPALFNDGAAVVFKAREEGKEPVYLQQSIIFHSAAYRLGENSRIFISTNCNDVRSRLGLYQPTAIITCDGEQVAQVKSTLTFPPREKVLEAIAASKGGVQ